MKKCPHCASTVNTRALCRVPRKVAPRWFQFTPAPHAACPQCGGFVTSTIANSPWLFALLLLLVGGAVLTFIWPAIGVFAGSLVGRVALLAITGAMAWLAIKNSELVREPPQR